MIKITLPIELVQQVVNLLGEIPAKHSAKALLDFVAAANQGEKLDAPLPAGGIVADPPEDAG